MTNHPAVATAAGAPARGLAGFGRVFWTLNTIEMWERLAYYNLRVMAPIYIMQADNPGGLHLTAADKGTIYAWWAIFQSLLPIVTGGYADRFGYKRTLGFAITLMIAGFLIIALLRDLPFISNYHGLFLGILVLATGTAFFKPSLQGSLAHNMTREQSSVGWGLFYWVVNVGAFIGHFLPSLLLVLSALLPGPLHAEPNSPDAWRNLFLASALFSSFNLLLLFAVKDTPSGASSTETLLQVLGRTLRNVCEPRLLAWLLIMSGFWMMMYQLWDLQPNFIADWVDSRAMAESLAWLPQAMQAVLIEQTPRGPMIPQQVLLSANAFFIILGVVGMSWLTRNIRTLTAMLFGMLFATCGVLVAGLTASPWILLLGILLFSLGEMTTGPKKNEYLALIAPPDRKGLYLGYVNIPVGIGVFAGSKIAGYVYGHYGEKAVLAQRWLAENTLPAGQWDGNIATLAATLGIPRTAAMAELSRVTGLDRIAASEMLWNTYHPQLWVWIPFALVGVVSALALFVFGRMALRWSDMNA